MDVQGHDGGQENQGSFRVNISDGRVFEIQSRAGANGFLEAQAFSFSNNINNVVEPMRAKLQKEPLSGTARREISERLVQAYWMMGSIAQFASPEIFEEKIPTIELEAFITHASSVFQDLASSPKWSKTGVLSKHDQLLLDIIINFCNRAKFCKTALTNHQLFDILAKLIAARPGAKLLPIPDVTNSIFSITNNLLHTLISIVGWEKEKAFKKVEACGLLAQSLRCITVPEHPVQSLPSYLNFLDVLSGCIRLIQKKLKPGEPSGDVLANILMGNDGYKNIANRNPAVMQRLLSLQALATLSNASSLKDKNGDKLDTRACRYCNKSKGTVEEDLKLLDCSVCKSASYCSKECQKADWKAHKPLCVPLDKAADKLKNANTNLMMAFVQQHYCSIMTAIMVKVDKTGLDKSDLVLELDFQQDETAGSAPALRNPPVFNVVPTQSYLEDGRPKESNWIFKGTDVYDSYAPFFLNGLRDNHGRMDSDHLLCIGRHPSGSASVYRMQWQPPGSTVPGFSDQALAAYTRAMKDREFHGLSSVFGLPIALDIIRHCNGTDDDAQKEIMIAEAKSVIDSYGGRTHR